MAATYSSSNINLHPFFIISFFYLCISSQYEPTHSSEFCDKTGQYKYNFNDNSVRANIEKSITQLESRASTTYYSNTSVGSGRDRFNAFFSCRYDISPQTCQSCVTIGAEHFDYCLPNVAYFITYEECTLRYSNRTIFSVMEDKPLLSHYSHRQDEGDEDRFKDFLYKNFNALIGSVISEFDVSSRYFATITAKYSSRETFYALAQCNPDITAANCSTCLENIVDEFNVNLVGVVYGKFSSPSCRLSYIFSTKELIQPWNFQQTYDQIYAPTRSTGTLGRSFLGAVTSMLSVAMYLKLLL